MTRRSPGEAGAVPHYMRIKEQILAMIKSGELRPGDRVYSENELVASFGVSRMTANRALRELMFEGALTRSARLGTFVSAQRHDVDLLQIRNIAEEVASRGHRHRARVVTAARMKANAVIAEALELPLGVEVLHTLIVHLENDDPIQVEDRYVNPTVVPDYLANDFQTTTPNEYLTKVAPITDFEHFVEAVRPTGGVRTLLGVAADQPCLCVYRRTWSGSAVVTCAILTYPGDKYRLEARSSNMRAKPGASHGDGQS